MPLEAYTGSSIPPLLARAEAEFGDDAVMFRVDRIARWDGSGSFELVAGSPDAAESARTYVTGGNVRALTNASPDPRSLRKRNARGPAVIAVVGPTGSGKTTTLAKMATSPKVFGRRSVGFITTDTYRVGAVEQLRVYADVARLSLEIVQHERDADRALARLSDCEIVLVDTPGYGPNNTNVRGTLQTLLNRLQPHEVHLTLPAWTSGNIAQDVLRQHLELGVTHLIPTKLDEVGSSWSIFDLAADHHVPTRWCTNGQRVPTDIRPAGPRLTAALASSRRRHVPLAEAV